MKMFALIAGIVLVLLGIAGFAKLLAIATMYAVVLIIAGALFELYGVTHRSSLIPTRTTGHDLRDV
ncbi:MAG TPA: hypothetical protein VLJ84_08280 [Usitatibacter sp.]|nr:hypothetical protein [Usitatibacter sp.]